MPVEGPAAPDRPDQAGPAAGAARFDPAQLAPIYDTAAVRQQRRRTRELLAARPGHRVLDLGCGAGHLTAELAGDVGSDGQVLGLYRQASMLTAARERVAAGGQGARCDFVVGEATTVPAADGVFDRAVAVQVLEYVADVGLALAELHRVVRPGGAVVLVDTDWRSCVWHTTDRHRTDRVLAAWERHFVHPQLPASMPGLLRTAGFAVSEVVDVPVVETEPASAGYRIGMADTIAAFLERREPGVTAAWREDVLGKAAQDDYFFSVTRFAAVASR